MWGSVSASVLVLRENEKKIYVRCEETPQSIVCTYSLGHWQDSSRSCTVGSIEYEMWKSRWRLYFLGFFSNTILSNFSSILLNRIRIGKIFGMLRNPFLGESVRTGFEDFREIPILSCVIITFRIFRRLQQIFSYKNYDLAMFWKKFEKYLTNIISWLFSNFV